VIVIHGGAWAIPEKLEVASREGVKNAAKAGWKVLSEGGSAVDAVMEAVKLLENDPAFDAGRGSVLTDAGNVEMDALIMDGKTLDCGSVATVNNVKNPVELARKVMEKTPHTLIVGEGANTLAKEENVEAADKDYLVTAEGVEEWETYKKYNVAVSSLFGQRGHDTVGAVALDKGGNLACATSTGGITGKRPGRVGDSPIVGSGGYADNESGAVSTTGHGESITKVCLAHRIVQSLESGGSPQEAAGEGLRYMFSRVGGSGGAVVVDKEGRFAAEFSTEKMPWAAISMGTMEHGFMPGERNKEQLGNKTCNN